MVAQLVDAHGFCSLWSELTHRPCWVGVAVDSLPERTGAHRMADLGMIAAAAEGNNPPVLVADLIGEDK